MPTRIRLRSPIYLTARGYDLTMRALYGRSYEQTFRDVAALIAPGASVVDLCCGTAGLYRFALRDRACVYSAHDANPHFINTLRRAGIDAHRITLPEADVPTADYVVMISSFYHFRRSEDFLIDRLKEAAVEAVIISEPVITVSRSRIKPLAYLANVLTDPGIGDFSFRYDLESFQAFARRHRASHFIHHRGERNAIAVFCPSPARQFNQC